MTTRVDVTKRLELVEGRRAWLMSELKRFQTEYDDIQVEYDMLKQLEKHYADNPTDAIDAGRAQIFETPKPTRRPSKGDVSELVALAIEELGEAQTRDIVRATGLEPKQVSNAVFNLKTQGVIAADGRTYTMAE